MSDFKFHVLEPTERTREMAEMWARLNALEEEWLRSLWVPAVLFGLPPPPKKES